MGSVVSVPSASLIATHANCQTTFLTAVAGALLAVVIQALVIPKIPAADRVTTTHFTPLPRPLPANIILAVVFLATFDQFRPVPLMSYLHVVTSLSTGAASGLLLGYGIPTIVGNFGGGSLLGRSMRGTVVAFLIPRADGLLSWQP
ncbi:hypothetical protein [Streptomyces sp. SCL15-6]|uniref:hypothetical protein n=1 Tax=Streptomyces sp. SCL15-6 TaxID=2967222 RepID=UPI0029670BA6|nr:hypothetical protein [Streptomyces sp. SCL15-6]